MDFIKRVNSQAHNKKCLQSLILAGAFDSFGLYRSQLIEVYETAVSRAQQQRKNKESGQISVFDDAKDDCIDIELKYPDIKEYTKAKLKLKKLLEYIYPDTL